MSRIRARSDGNSGRGAGRGQSELVGIVLLLGAVMVGATLVVVLGGMLVDGLQQASEGEMARDNARQAHASLTQAASTGEARSVPDPDEAVDARVVEGGTLTVTMHDETGPCSDRVSEELGAIEYASGDRTFVYEGGAIWERTEAGLSIEQHPPIEHDADGTAISVLAVTSTGADGGGLVAEPDEDERQRVSRAVERMLTRCPQSGHTDLRINVSSPHASVWTEHFEERVNTSANVSVTATDDWVRATVANATTARDDRGLALTGVTHDTDLAPSEDFAVDVEVVNQDFAEGDGTVELDVDGIAATPTASETVDPGDTWNSTLAIDAGTLDATLSGGDLHTYTVTFTDDEGNTTSVDGSFYLEPTDGRVSIAHVDHELDDDATTLTVEATLRNPNASDASDVPVDFEVTEPGVSTSPQTETVDVPGTYGRTRVTYETNVSGLHGGYYDYDVSIPTDTETRTVRIDRDWGELVDSLRVEDVDVAGSHLEPGDSFWADVQLSNEGGTQTSGEVRLDVRGETVTRSVNVDAGDGETVRLELDADDVEGLGIGERHAYTVEVEEPNDTLTESGSFYLGEPGPALGIESADHTLDDETLTIDASLENVGSTNGSDALGLSIESSDGQEVFDSSSSDYEVVYGTDRDVTLELDVSDLAGNYEYDLTYGGDATAGTFELDALEGNGSSVGSRAAGEGTVTVLGTEISGEWVEDPLDDEWIKRWAPTSVTMIEERNGTRTESQFRNDRADDDVVEDPRNLNTHDTQEATYSRTWNQSAGEEVYVTVRSTYWNARGGYQRVNVRDEDGRTWNDRQPRSGLGSEAFVVDSTADAHPENVQILRDGDEVPRVSGVNPDQRNASEILRDGAAGRIDPDTNELELGPNERIVLFEMTTTTDDVPGNMWEYALEHDVSDPDYNDVIAIVEFDAEGVDGDVEEFVRTGPAGNGVTVSLPDVDAPTGSQSVRVDDTSGDENDGVEPEAADVPGGADPSSTPDEVAVEVDVVTLQ